jgi:1-acyl-sn-glycerol-3-phosphate acyltransferase
VSAEARVASFTWNEVAPPELPPLRLRDRARGALRAAAAALATALALAAFLLGRGLRRTLAPGVSFHFAAARLWSRVMLWLIGARLEVRGAPMREGGALLANHSSWADIPALRATGLLYFVSKAEVRGWPGVGWIAEVCGTVFVERRRGAAPAQRAELRDRMIAGRRLLIFPEGTSSDGRRVLPFKSTLLSALFEPEIRPLACAQPVTVDWRPGPGLPPEFYGWWGNMPFGAHVLSALSRGRGGRVVVTFHPPRPVAGFPDRKALARWAEAAVREGLAG